MKLSVSHDTREALGCFVMLILGGILTLGATLVVIPRGIMALLGGDVTGLGSSAIAWIAAPAAGMALMAWLVYGFKQPRSPKQRG
jgi:hypothetical protein